MDGKDGNGWNRCYVQKLDDEKTNISSYLQQFPFCDYKNLSLHSFKQL